MSGPPAAKNAEKQGCGLLCTKRIFMPLSYRSYALLSMKYVNYDD